MPPETRRTTIALTAEANAVVDKLCDEFGLPERAHAAKLGIAYAIRRDLEPLSRRTAPTGPAGSTWGVAGFDTDGKLRELMQAVFPDRDEDPYATVENLMNAGLVELAKALAERRPQTLADLLTIAD
jgi:hypothetical protein